MTYGISTRKQVEPVELESLIDRWIYNQIRTHPGMLATTLYRKARHPESEIETSLYRLIALGLVRPDRKSVV